MNRSNEMDAYQCRLFEEWRNLHQKALSTLDPKDAHASGQAYRRFHEAYLIGGRESAEVIPLLRVPNGIGGTV